MSVYSSWNSKINPILRSKTLTFELKIVKTSVYGRRLKAFLTVIFSLVLFADFRNIEG